ncbi:hypothetical protein Bpfe_031534 [Biomphalaria pfeifferi]|uniref:Uncharacterized protein n=1 Tax=Biomphalaria pfeifferi TaxID=112525 RepID=A0AAD8ETW4_BIOPF|nr:hypothetical protein Bpfe_031534 [Biomphalaria pfeifferi]
MPSESKRSNASVSCCNIRNTIPPLLVFVHHRSVLVPAGTGAAYRPESRPRYTGTGAARLHLDASIDQFASEDRPCWPRPVQDPSLGGAVPSWFLRGQALCARSSIARTGL